MGNPLIRTPANKHRVVGSRQIGQNVASLVVGDDDLGEFRWQVGRFGDHPDASFRAFRAGDNPTDVVCVERDVGVAALLCAELRERGRESDRHSQRSNPRIHTQ